MQSEPQSLPEEPSSKTRLDRLKRSLTYAAWITAPYATLSAKGIYDLFATDVLSDEGLFLNMGYWRNASTMDEACRAMVDLVGERAALGPNDEVLDVGFGFGEQDMQWTRRFQPKKIIGINITESQVEVAKKRVAAEALSDRIDLRVGSATELPFEANSFDKVIALECAQHFDTREAFFKEAFRVLRPGGRLVTADILPLEEPGGAGWLDRMNARFMWWQYCRMWVVPKPNQIPREAYQKQLEGLGFGSVAIDSIRDDVYPQYHGWLKRRDFLERFDPVVRAWTSIMVNSVSAEKTYVAHDYVIATADKP